MWLPLNQFSTHLNQAVKNNEYLLDVLPAGRNQKCGPAGEVQRLIWETMFFYTEYD